MTLREIIENPDRWGEFLRTVSKIAVSNNNSANRQHGNQRGWDKLLDDYEEYLQDVETAIRDANGREGHKRNELVMSIKAFASKIMIDKKIDALREMKYRDYEIDAIRKYHILKKFFDTESRKIKDGKAVVNDRIRKLLGRFEKLEAYCLSVDTEADNGKNNKKLSRKHGL